MTITIPIANRVCETILRARMDYYYIPACKESADRWTQLSVALNYVKTRRQVMKYEEFYKLTREERNTLFTAGLGPS